MPKPNNDIADWETALYTAAAVGQITGLTQVDAQVWKAYPGKTLRGWDNVARYIGGYVPGGTIARNSNGLTWRMGRRWAGSLIHGEDIKTVLDARSITSEIVKVYGVAEKWSVGQCARVLLDFIGEPELCPKKPYSLPSDVLLYPVDATGQSRPSLAHDECTPGVYPYGELWDCRDAYPTMLRFIANGKRFSLRPSVFVEGSRMGIDWGVWRPGERERLNLVLSTVWEHRTLCRAIWGSALGSYDWRKAYTPIGNGDSKAIWLKGGAGPFRSAALLAARTMKDLCWEQCNAVGAVYGTVDSYISTTPDTEPEIWNRYGVTSRSQYVGSWDIRGRGCWGVWNPINGNGERLDQAPPQDRSPLWLERKEPYLLGGRNLLPVKREKTPLRVFRLWL